MKTVATKKSAAMLQLVLGLPHVTHASFEFAWHKTSPPLKRMTEI